VLSHSAAVCSIRAPMQDSAVYFRMQRLHPPVQHFGESISTCLTANLRITADWRCPPVEDQFPEMLDGRVKTLHPKVHGGICIGARMLHTAAL